MGKLVLAVYRRSRELDVSRLSAHAGFFMVLSVFPALVLLMNLLKLWSLGAEQLLTLLENTLPPALLTAARALIRSAGDSARFPLGLSALTALWSAGKGMDGLRTGLEAVCRKEEEDSWLRQRVEGAAYTLALLLATALVLGVGVLFPWFLRFAPVVLGVGMYHFLPKRPRALWWSLPGALLSWVGITLFSWGFSLYVSVSGLFGIYGSVYILALGMLWLYGCLLILFVGGILNEILWENMSEP